MRRRRRPLLASVVAVAVAALTAFTTGTLPAPAATTAAPKAWMNAADTPAQRADALLAQMTNAEKITMMHGGAQCAWGACVDANTRLGIPQLRLQDGPAGVADGAGGVTQLPAPVAAAASWDRDLAKSYGQVIGNEEWGKGANVVLGPTINIVRDPRWGRAFESLGEDPYLAGELGAADIQGIQSQGPMAQVKHYADYNQETNRNNAQDNVILSERAQREIYLPAFEAAVKQGQAYSVMCSYASVAGTYACENARLIQQVLEGDLGFTGFVTSDWGGTHSTVASANAGLDQEMNGSDFYGTALTNAVNSGQVSQANLDGHVRRILTAMFASGLFDTTQTGTITTPVTTDAHKATARQVAEEGSVLLKNASSALPLGSANKKIAVIGDDAGPNALSAGGGSAHVGSSSVVTPYSAITTRAGGGASVTYAQGYASPGGEIVDSPYLTPSQGSGHGLYGQFYNGTSLGGSPIASGVDPTLNFLWGGASPKSGVPATGWSAKWTGTLTPPSTGTYTFALSSDDGSRLYINGQQVIGNWANQPTTTKTGTVSLTANQPVSIEVDYFQDGGGSELELGWQIPNQDLHGQAVTAARNADTAIVFVNKSEGEGADLGDISLSGDQNQLVSDVAAVNPNTIVVINSGSAIALPWADAVRGIVENWYPGQEDGNAIAALLYGDVNFSGKLPVTFPVSLNDVPAHTTAQWPGQNGTVQYSEGLNVGYRWYDSQNKTPLYPFGFGLSYTTFAYSGLTVSAPDASGNVTVAFDVKNTGSRAGAEVPQVYVGQPTSAGEPPKNLRGFQRVSLNAGQTQHVTVTLNARSFQFWNNGWTNAAGTNTIYVGASSRDIKLTGQTTIGSGGGTTPPGQTTAITLRAHANNQYVTAENAGAAALIANRTAIGPWETFDEIDLGNGTVALRAHANNKYVTAPNNGAGSLIASSTSVGAAETFDLIHDPDGAVTLRAHADNQYVTAENAGAAALIANRTAIGPWEEFDLIQD
ncbi:MULTISPECIES: glycoside hydrolase family 3 C-terminal domain-containing protein [unclassified Streptomyces]|uniref:glycoside hydrolase family 3 C-terminal domain-containing protein n=1 Tax=unclassified Streptomyces TaxID=2593676 RepID=UPI002E2A2B95|nr:glycoside hydrolase family 3 C-terminal domain-containing protein [Streptomyces sp. NBC_00223]